ncbi:MAG: amidohydrolase [Cyclobacteriaceae bacterium]
MNNLVLALFQSNLYWQDRVANLAMFEEKIWELDQSVDIIVLPEMFTTGFTMNTTGFSEPMHFHTTKWMQQMAAQTKSIITGSLIISDGGKFFNRLLWVMPEGQVKYYDKRHLFRMAKEDNHFDMGRKNEIIEWKGWKILPQICYDLRFPVWSRNQVSPKGELEYDLSFYVASWPASRVMAWDALLKARAIENLCYSIGVNRIGTDGNGVAYCGHSAAYDFKGNQLAFAGVQEMVLTVSLNKNELLDYRRKFPAWMDADNYEVK